MLLTLPGCARLLETLKLQPSRVLHVGQTQSPVDGQQAELLLGKKVKHGDQETKAAYYAPHLTLLILTRPCCLEESGAASLGITG